MPTTPVVAHVNGVDIKQSDLDFAASEVGPRLANYTQADRKRVLLQYVIENELMAEAAEKDGLDKAANFPDRAKYHQRRALRDAFFDMSITNGVSDDAAKKIFDEKIGSVKPEQEIHARHILVPTEEEAKKVAERIKNGEDFATVAKEVSKDTNSRRRRSRFLYSRPDAEAVRGCGVRARCRPGLGAGADAIRLAHHQGRREA